jgi:transposase
MHLNNVALIGSLGSDADAQTTKNGASYTVTRHQAVLDERLGQLRYSQESVRSISIDFRITNIHTTRYISRSEEATAP